MINCIMFGRNLKKLFTLHKQIVGTKRLKCGILETERREPPRLDVDKVIYGGRTGDETVNVGCEKTDPLSERPPEYQNRVARVFQRPKNVMQQGTDNTRTWILTYGTQERWENPTMGWSSSGDSLSNVYMEFPSMCAAICYAEKNGFKWVKEDPPVVKPAKKSYADNFSWNRRTRVSTK